MNLAVQPYEKLKIIEQPLNARKTVSRERGSTPTLRHFLGGEV